MFQQLLERIKKLVIYNKVNEIKRRPQEIEDGSRCVNDVKISFGFGVRQAEFKNLFL